MGSRARRCRREFLRGSLGLAGLGLLSGCAAFPRAGLRPARPARIGWLEINAATASPVRAQAQLFRDALRELGHVEGETVTLEWRHADGREERLADLAAELAGLPVDVIVVNISTPAALAAKRATDTIPIAFVGQADPVTSGLVVSFSQPGGNVTGVSSLEPGLGGKPLQLLRDAVPTIARAAIIWHADNPSTRRLRDEAGRAAEAMGLEIIEAGVRAAEEVENAFLLATRERADGVLAIGAAIFNEVRGRMVELALAHRLPGAGTDGGAARAGFLLGYGPNFPALYRQSAEQVDQILKGSKPSNLPVRLPTKFDFLINLKTAQALGLSIPPSVLQQATEVIP